MGNEISIYNSRKADKNTIWILFLLFAWSYGSLGSMGKQIFFYLTLGGFGVWWLYRLFTLNSAIKEYNKGQAILSGVSTDDILKLGLL
tara:strand:+ start:1028 stop:1291 length:264 start_codon:yes stop_codon:yes gene_type:complete